jgi:3-deoxy-D-manno-octulosonic-acid transferase
MHGASLGECRLLLEVIRTLEVQPILLTTQKVEVKKFLQKSLPSHVQICLAPGDHPQIMERFFASGTPRCLVLCENELWPSWIDACQKRQVPVVLISGRMTQKAFDRWRRWGATELSLALHTLDAIWIQDVESAKRFAYFAPRHMQISGDWKWLGVEPSEGKDWGARSIDLALISVHQEEWKFLEEGILKHIEFGGDCVLVPRIPAHAQWFRRKLKKQGCPVVDWPDHCRGAVSLVSQFGMVQQVLGDSRLALVGGSFCALGVHNFREPLLQGVPVLVGPQSGTQEAEITRLETEGVLRRIEDLSLVCIGREGRDLWVSGWFPWEACLHIKKTIEMSRHSSQRALSELVKLLAR